MNNIDILDINECTDCSVCYQVCSHDAIKMLETNEGFRYTFINEEKCTNCGICVKRCHALNNDFKTEYKQEIYEVVAFPIIANYIFENNGYVYVASFTKYWLGVEHIIINDIFVWYRCIVNATQKNINRIAWCILVKKYRENFRSKFTIRAEQSRAEQSRAEQSRADLIYVAITYIFIIIQKIKKYNLHCNMKLQCRFFCCINLKD